jgi:hypothetical protein
MLESLFAINYTGSVEGRVYGYTLGTAIGGDTVATIREIVPMGTGRTIGCIVVPRIGHASVIRSYVAEWIVSN